MFDQSKIKEQFPIFNAPINKDLVFLDSGASAQKPEQVLKAMDNFYRNYYANIHRGVYKLAEKASAAYEEARAAVANFVNAESPHEIIFTRGTTSGLNLLAASLTTNLTPSDEILLTELEHHANLVPWQQAAQKHNLILRFIPVDKNGQLILSDLNKLINSKTKIVSVSGMSNVTGEITNLKTIIKAAHTARVLTIIDASQAAAHVEIDVKELNCDFLAFSGHKIYGPTGIGVLYGKTELLNKLEPFEYGGGMINEVSFENATWANVPDKFEAGTPPIAEVVGLAEAIKFITKIGWRDIQDHENKITTYGLEQLTKINNLRLVGPTDVNKRGAVFSFVVDKIHPHDLASLLDEVNIAVRAGHHCAMPLHAKLGLIATTRASFGLYNTIEDVDALVAGIKRAQVILG
ncbi:MAG: SufS family cysteine desulfurase [Patescibacteria group bacterium]